MKFVCFCIHFHENAKKKTQKNDKTMRHSVLIFIHVVPYILQMSNSPSVCPPINSFGQNNRLNFGIFAVTHSFALWGHPQSTYATFSRILPPPPPVRNCYVVIHLLIHQRTHWLRPPLSVRTYFMDDPFRLYHSSKILSLTVRLGGHYMLRPDIFQVCSFYRLTGRMLCKIY